jgi:hypothetical protein
MSRNHSYITIFEKPGNPTSETRNPKPLRHAECTLIQAERKIQRIKHNVLYSLDLF